MCGGSGEASRCAWRVMSRAEGRGREDCPPTRPVGSRPIFRPLEFTDTTISSGSLERGPTWILSAQGTEGSKHRIPFLWNVPLHNYPGNSLPLHKHLRNVSSEPRHHAVT
jgi:hypothetical protein